MTVGRATLISLVIEPPRDVHPSRARPRMFDQTAPSASRTKAEVADRLSGSSCTTSGSLDPCRPAARLGSGVLGDALVGDVDGPDGEVEEEQAGDEREQLLLEERERKPR